MVIAGPVVEEQEEIDPPGPVRVQVIAPVGATDPVAPVATPVKVIICPLVVLDWIPLTLRATVPLPTFTVLTAEVIGLKFESPGNEAVIE